MGAISKENVGLCYTHPSSVFIPSGNDVLMIMGWVKGVKLCFDYILETLKYFKEPIHEICVYALLVRLLSMLQDF